MPYRVVLDKEQLWINISRVSCLVACAGDRDTVEDKARNAVDVRDLADAFVLAYETPEASGRYICGAYRKKLSEMAGPCTAREVRTDIFDLRLVQARRVHHGCCILRGR